MQLTAQENKEPSSSLKANKIERFTSFFNKTIDLNIPSAKANYSDNQAKVLVQNFFANSKFKVYTTKHTGGGSGRPFYEIGKLETESGNYRTYLLFQEMNETINIIEFRIEKE